MKRSLNSTCAKFIIFLSVFIMLNILLINNVSSVETCDNDYSKTVLDNSTFIYKSCYIKTGGSIYLDFDGINSTSRINFMNTSKNGTISLWVYNKNNSFRDRVLQRGIGDYPSFNRAGNNNSLIMEIYNGSDYFTVTSLYNPVGSWFNVMFEWGSNGMKSYYNSMISHTHTSTYSPRTIEGYDMFYYLGTNNASGIGTYLFNGSIKEITYYNRSLNKQERESIVKGGYVGDYTKTQNISLMNFIILDNKIIKNGSEFEGDNTIREIGNTLFNATGKNEYVMTYTGHNGTYTDDNSSIFWANSSDGINWEKQGRINLTTFGEDPYMIYNGTNFFLYMEDKSPDVFRNISLSISSCNNYSCFNSSWTEFSIFDRLIGSNWEDQDVSSPVVLKEGDNWYLWYEGRNYTQTGNIGLAYSTNGINWVRDLHNPFVVGNLTGWDFRSIVPDDIIKKDNNYYLSYHGYRSLFQNGIIVFSNISVKEDYKRYENPICDFDTIMFLNNETDNLVYGLNHTNEIFSGNYYHGSFINSLPPRDNLIFGFKLNEGNGTLINDSYGINTNLSVNTATWKDDMEGFIQFINNNWTDNQIIEGLNFNSELIYLSNGSLPCSNTLFTGDCNITLTPNNWTYVYDNYNKSEGRDLTGDPFRFIYADNKTKFLNSSLVVSVQNIPVSVLVDNCSITRFDYTPVGGIKTSITSFTCVNNVSNFTLPVVNPSYSDECDPPIGDDWEINTKSCTLGNYNNPGKYIYIHNNKILTVNGNLTIGRIIVDSGSKLVKTNSGKIIINLFKLLDRDINLGDSQ